MKAVVGIDGSKYGEWALEWLMKLPCHGWRVGAGARQRR